MGNAEAEEVHEDGHRWHRWPGVHGWEGGSRGWVMRVRVKATPRPKTLDPRSRHSGYCPDCPDCRLLRCAKTIAIADEPSINRLNRLNVSVEERRTRGRKGKKKHTCIKKYGQRTRREKDSRLHAKQNNEKGSQFSHRHLLNLVSGSSSLQPPTRSFESGASKTASSKQQAADEIDRSVLALALPRKSFTRACFSRVNQSFQSHPSRRAAEPHQPATEHPGLFRLRISWKLKSTGE